jgi:hypothetical protein
MSAKKKKAGKAADGDLGSPSPAFAGRCRPCWLVGTDPVKRGSTAEGDLLDFVHSTVQVHPDDLVAAGLTPDSCVLVCVAMKSGEDMPGGTVGVGRVWPVAAVKRVSAASTFGATSIFCASACCLVACDARACVCVGLDGRGSARFTLHLSQLRASCCCGSAQ